MNKNRTAANHRVFAGLALVALVLSLIPTLVATAESSLAPVDPTIWQVIDQEGQADILIVLREQASLEGAGLLSTKQAKGQYVYERLTETAERTQPPLKAYLDQLDVAYRSYWIRNMLRVYADAHLVNLLARRPEVDHLEYVYPVYPDPVYPDPGPEAVEWNIARVNANDVWTTLGVTGQGAVVGSLDTGVDYTHEALVQQYRGCLDPPACTNFDHNYNWWEGPSGGEEPYDTGSHGTHTTGTAVGSDNPADPANAPHGIGVAPGARWIACPGIGSPYVGPFECFEFFLAPTDLNGENPQPELAPHVINNSWSSAGTNYREIIHTLYMAGIYYAKSAGNEGSNCSTVTNPGQWPEVTATAAFAQGDTIASFSSRGPVTVGLETVIKPDIAAPGVGVVSSIPGNSYGSMQGTSMACPHVTGAVALVVSARPDLAGQIDTIQHVLKSTAEPTIDLQCPPNDPSGVPNNVWGFGILNTYDAVSYAQSFGLGRVEGTVRDAGTAQPLEDARLDMHKDGTQWDLIPRFTNASGFYSYTLIPAGTYHLTATQYGYLPGTALVNIADGVTLTQDIDMDTAPLWTVDGTILEEGTHNPLWATLTFEGTPVTAESDPVTGYYSTEIAQGAFWTYVWSPGHARELTKIPIYSDVTRNFTLTAIYNYYLREGGEPCGPTFEWIDAADGERVCISDDSYQFINFGGRTFTFYGNDYTYGYIGSNGIFTFGQGDNKWPGPIPDPATPNNGIYAFGTDLNPASCSQGEIFYQWFDDLLVVEFYQVQHYPSGDPETFEIIMDFGTGAVWMQYLVVSDPANVIVGVENTDGTEATAYTGTPQNDLALGYGPAFGTPPYFAGEGSLEGIISDAGSGDPIEGAIVSAWAFAMGHAYTTTTAADGSYALQVCADTYNITASTPRYYPQTVEGVIVYSGTMNTQDFALAPAPAIVVAPTQLAAALYPDQQANTFLTITNDGDVPLTFTLTEAPAADWLAESPPTGMVNPSESVPVSVTFDAAGLGPGAYTTTLETHSNDPYTPLVPVAVTLTVLCEPVHEADFVWTPVTPTPSQVITLTGWASGSAPIAFAWDLGDGFTATGSTVTHTYPAPGDYNVVMTATNCTETASVAVTKTLSVVEACEPVHEANFGWTPITPTAGQVVTLTGWASGTEPIAFAWDFDDGLTGTGSIVTHTYTATGTYIVWMVATNCQGAGEEAVSHTLFVQEPCQSPAEVDFSWEPITPTFGQIVTFEGMATGTEPISFSWDFGDGFTGTGRSPVHIYAFSDTYTVTMTASNSCGEAQVSHALTVLAAPPGCDPVELLSYTADISGCQVAFSAAVSGTAPFEWLWTFGDGEFSTASNPIHTYPETDFYTVTLEVTNCEDEGYARESFVIAVDCPGPPVFHDVFLPIITKGYGP